MMSKMIALDRRHLIRYGTTVLILLLGAIWFFTLRSQTLGGPVDYVIVSGQSMEPTYYAGDLILMRKASQYEEGDIVQYTVPDGEPAAGTRVIHRIVGKDEAGYITRGDNNNGVDIWRPTGDDIAGQEWIRIPNAGTYFLWLRTPFILASLAALLTVYTVLTSGKKPQPEADAPGGGSPWKERVRDLGAHLNLARPSLVAVRAPGAMNATAANPESDPPSPPTWPPSAAKAAAIPRRSVSFPTDPRVSYALAALVAAAIACLALTSFQSGKDPSVK
jgi:signal peptidase